MFKREVNEHVCSLNSNDEPMVLVPADLEMGVDMDRHHLCSYRAFLCVIIIIPAKLIAGTNSVV
jgi:hypothetical protein